MPATSLAANAASNFLRPTFSSRLSRAASIRFVTADGSRPSAAASSLFNIPLLLPNTITASFIATVSRRLLLLHISSPLSHTHAFRRLEKFRSTHSPYPLIDAPLHCTPDLTHPVF